MDRKREREDDEDEYWPKTRRADDSGGEDAAAPWRTDTAPEPAFLDAVLPTRLRAREDPPPPALTTLAAPPPRIPVAARPLIVVPTAPRATGAVGPQWGAAVVVGAHSLRILHRQARAGPGTVVVIAQRDADPGPDGSLGTNEGGVSVLRLVQALLAAQPNSDVFIQRPHAGGWRAQEAVDREAPCPGCPLTRLGHYLWPCYGRPKASDTSKAAAERSRVADFVCPLVAPGARVHGIDNDGVANLLDGMRRLTSAQRLDQLQALVALTGLGDEGAVRAAEAHVRGVIETGTPTGREPPPPTDFEGVKRLRHAGSAAWRLYPQQARAVLAAASKEDLTPELLYAVEMVLRWLSARDAGLARDGGAVVAVCRESVAPLVARVFTAVTGGAAPPQTLLAEYPPDQHLPPRITVPQQEAAALREILGSHAGVLVSADDWRATTAITTPVPPDLTKGHRALPDGLRVCGFADQAVLRVRGAVVGAALRLPAPGSDAGRCPGGDAYFGEVSVAQLIALCERTFGRVVVWSFPGTEGAGALLPADVPRMSVADAGDVALTEGAFSVVVLPPGEDAAAAGLLRRTGTALGPALRFTQTEAGLLGLGVLPRFDAPWFAERRAADGGEAGGRGLVRSLLRNKKAALAMGVVVGGVLLRQWIAWQSSAAQAVLPQRQRDPWSLVPGDAQLPPTFSRPAWPYTARPATQESPVAQRPVTATAQGNIPVPRDEILATSGELVQQFREKPEFWESLVDLSTAAGHLALVGQTDEATRLGYVKSPAFKNAWISPFRGWGYTAPGFSVLVFNATAYPGGDSLAQTGELWWELGTKGFTTPQVAVVNTHYSTFVLEMHDGDGFVRGLADTDHDWESERALGKAAKTLLEMRVAVGGDSIALRVANREEVYLRDLGRVRYAGTQEEALASLFAAVRMQWQQDKVWSVARSVGMDDGQIRRALGAAEVRVSPNDPERYGMLGSVPPGMRYSEVAEIGRIIAQDREATTPFRVGAFIVHPNKLGLVHPSFAARLLMADGLIDTATHYRRTFACPRLSTDAVSVVIEVALPADMPRLRDVERTVSALPKLKGRWDAARGRVQDVFTDLPVRSSSPVNVADVLLLSPDGRLLVAPEYADKLLFAESWLTGKPSPKPLDETVVVGWGHWAAPEPVSVPKLSVVVVSDAVAGEGPVVHTGYFSAQRAAEPGWVLHTNFTANAVWPIDRAYRAAARAGDLERVVFPALRAWAASERLEASTTLQQQELAGDSLKPGYRRRQAELWNKYRQEPRFLVALEELTTFVIRTGYQAIDWATLPIIEPPGKGEPLRIAVTALGTVPAVTPERAVAALARLAFSDAHIGTVERVAARHGIAIQLPDRDSIVSTNSHALATRGGIGDAHSLDDPATQSTLAELLDQADALRDPDFPGKRRAVIVWLNEFKDEMPLSPVAQELLVAQSLESRGFDVTLVSDGVTDVAPYSAEIATTENIVRALSTAAAATEDGDQLFVLIVTHGKARGMQGVATTVSTGEWGSGNIFDYQIANALAPARKGKVTVLLGMCHAKAFLDDVVAAVGKNAIVFSSSTQYHTAEQPLADPSSPARSFQAHSLLRPYLNAVDRFERDPKLRADVAQIEDPRLRAMVINREMMSDIQAQTARTTRTPFDWYSSAGGGASGLLPSPTR